MKLRVLVPVLAIIVALLLNGCAPSTVPVRPAPVETAEPVDEAQAEIPGDQLRAAFEFRRRAEQATSPQERQRLLIKAAAAFLDSGYPLDARRTLQLVAPPAADENSLQQKRILLEKIALAEQAAGTQDLLLAARRDYPAPIALLLPVGGQFAEAANAVRDGFLAAYYTRQQGAGTTIRIYEASAENVAAVYQQAVTDGMRFVVGPLEKQAVQALAGLGALPVPVLALNHIDNTTPANFFQFSLSPEDEARQVAERIWLDGHSQGIALVPEGAWGDRVYQALAERLEQLGSSILEKQTYPPREKDFSKTISALLNVDESRQRRRALRAALGEKIEFENRRRQDVDFVFIAAFPGEARLIRPILKFYNASGLPVYSTSHTYTGIRNASLDSDMNDIVFADMPWVLSDDTGNSRLRDRIQRLWPESAGKYMRLYAFGMDAFDIIPYLETMQQSRQSRYSGHTGYIQLSPENMLHRKLIWARFTDGVPRLIE